MTLLQWRDGPKGPEHLVRLGQHRRSLRASPLYEEAWLTRAGMRAHRVSRDVLDKAKKKEETGEGWVKRESPKKEEDEGIEVDIDVDVAEDTQPDILQDAEDAENAEDAKDDEDGADSALNGNDVEEAEDAHDAASQHSNEG